MLMYLEFKHIGKNDNVVADMLLQARYNDEGAMVDGEEDVGNNFYSMTLTRRNEIGLATPLELVLAWFVCVWMVGYWRIFECIGKTRRFDKLFYSGQINMKTFKAREWNAATSCV